MRGHFTSSRTLSRILLLRPCNRRPFEFWSVISTSKATPPHPDKMKKTNDKKINIIRLVLLLYIVTLFNNYAQQCIFKYLSVFAPFFLFLGHILLLFKNNKKRLVMLQWEQLYFSSFLLSHFISTLGPLSPINYTWFEDFYGWLLYTCITSDKLSFMSR